MGLASISPLFLTQSWSAGMRTSGLSRGQRVIRGFRATACRGGLLKSLLALYLVCRLGFKCLPPHFWMVRLLATASRAAQAIRFFPSIASSAAPGDNALDCDRVATYQGWLEKGIPWAWVRRLRETPAKAPIPSRARSRLSRASYRSRANRRNLRR